VARLRETARVYLACGANAREAAERLTMHKNTVHYRLSRIEDLLGHPITERRLELEVALTLVHTLGDRILPQG
jgi:DNA-binding PucR family transcriptional regulator